MHHFPYIQNILIGPNCPCIFKDVPIFPNCPYISKIVLIIFLFRENIKIVLKNMDNFGKYNDTFESMTRIYLNFEKSPFFSENVQKNSLFTFFIVKNKKIRLFIFGKIWSLKSIGNSGKSHLILQTKTTVDNY